MKILRAIIFSFCLCGPTTVLADLVEEISRGPASDEYVLDDALIANEWSEPIFSKQGRQRDIANVTQDNEGQEADFVGELAVQREIPFTYPVVSVLTLQARALNEIEAQEARKK